MTYLKFLLALVLIPALLMAGLKLLIWAMERDRRIRKLDGRY